MSSLKPINIISNANVKPDIWFHPKIIWEIRMDTVSSSPIYYIHGDN